MANRETEKPAEASESSGDAPEHAEEETFPAAPIAEDIEEENPEYRRS